MKDDMRDGKAYTRRYVQWECVCDCGNVALVASGPLRFGSSRSCGCFLGTLSATAAMEALLRNYKGGAKTRGLHWGLTREQFFELTHQDCTYCGRAPASIVNVNRKSGKKGVGATYVYNGIDRMDNSLGYEPSNCLPCCKICNLAKRDMARAEFIEWLHGGRAYQAMGATLPA
jgi:hypothetical protein